MGKIWNLEGLQKGNVKNPALILKEYAKRMQNDTNDIFRGVVTDAINEETSSVTYSLYVVVPELKNYMYRLIEMEVNNWEKLYPVRLKLLAKDPKNNQISEADNPKECKQKLEDMISSNITIMIMQHLLTLIDIMKDDEKESIGLK